MEMIFAIALAVIGCAFLVIDSYISNKKMEKLYQDNNKYMENIIINIRNEYGSIDKEYSREEILKQIDLWSKELDFFDTKNK